LWGWFSLCLLMALIVYSITLPAVQARERAGGVIGGIA
jgi:hypothetical protein